MAIQNYDPSSINRAIDALLLCFTQSLGPMKDVIVYDGLPDQLPPNYVTIGGTAASTADGEQEWAGLGNRAQWEKYVLQGIISCYVGGSNDGTSQPALPTSGNAQRTAREKAFAIYKVLNNAMLNDVQLLAYGKPFASGSIETVRLIGLETNTNDQNSAYGRRFDIEFAVQVSNYLGAL